MTTSDSSEADIRSRHLERENELLLSQLHHAQEELERQALLNRRKENQIASGVGPITVTPVVVAQGLSLLTKLTDLIGLTIKKKIAVIEQSGFFDSDWYLGNYSDVAEKGWNPVEHYLRFGSKEKRNPSPVFDTAWYLERYPDVAKSGMNPLLHYIRMGRSEGRQPSDNQQSGADISCVGQAMQKLASHLDEHAREIEKLARSREEQAVLSAERQSRIETLTQAHAAQEAEKRALSEQRNRLEGVLAAITQEQNERQQHIEKESELAERQFAEIKQWLLSEAHV